MAAGTGAETAVRGGRHIIFKPSLLRKMTSLWRKKA
jgi:hypothetical protein